MFPYINFEFPTSVCTYVLVEGILSKVQGRNTFFKTKKKKTHHQRIFTEFKQNFRRK